VKSEIVPGNGPALFHAGVAIEIALKAPEVHRWEGMVVWEFPESRLYDEAAAHDCFRVADDSPNFAVASQKLVSGQ